MVLTGGAFSVYMRRTFLVSGLLIAGVVVIALLFGLTSRRANEPRYTRAPAQIPVRTLTYDFLGPRPFSSDRMWLAGGSNAVIYDLRSRRVLGQVSNGWPLILYGDPPRLLCCQPAPVVAPLRLRQRLLTIAARLSFGRLKLPPVSGGTYWILDLAKDRATRLGDIPGNFNSLSPSPDFHYAFTLRVGLGLPDVYLFNLADLRIQPLIVPGWPSDWWDPTQILVQATNNDFVLYDVGTGSVAPLISSAAVATFLQQKRISAPASQTHAFAIWNGRENDFYLTDTHQKWLAASSFLIKVERPNGALKLISEHFKFEWSDHLDASGRYYLYSGRQAGNGSDGVFLRDLAAGTNRVLVPPMAGSYFSLPRFYGDSVIYVRSNVLWQTSVDGRTNSRLFPAMPPGGADR